MRYEDASGTFSSQDTGATDARDDADALPAGSRGPATGNTITGEGTITGAAGADIVDNGPGKIVALEGASGSATADGGSLHVEGRFGEITMDSRGGYSYTPHAAKPEGGSDVFRYTLADAEGKRDTATLTIDIGREIEKIDANAQQLVPGPDGVITLPPGVELSDIMVVGRNLVINMPDGTQMVIIDGAVFVPQLVINGVEVPATNLASLLIDAEPQPAAGTPLSSGGNFAVDVPPLDPGVPLGDLIPPTELVFEPPIFEDVGQFEDDEPEIFVQPDGQPASVAAVDSVNEAGLPTRNGGEPAGSGESADGNSSDNDDSSETTTGVILIDAQDDPAVVTINGIAVTSVGQVIAGAHGNLTITSISDTVIGYSYTLTDNTSGNATHDDFTVTVTDNDGDQATATLTIDIVDDVPTARPDTDAIASGQYGPVTGNVITDASAGDVGDSDTNAADTVGADNATITLVSSVNVPANSDNSGPFVVNGQYGVLTLQADGNYSYVRNEGTPGGVNDVFNYTLTDGDGDTSTTTLTISIADAFPSTGPNAVVRTDDDAVPGAGGNPGGPEDNIDAENLAGTLAGSGGDGPLTFDLLLTGAPAGFTYVDGPGGSVLVQQVQDGVTVTVLTITVNSATGAYTVTQNAPIEHPSLDGQEGDDIENNVSFTINYTVTDQDNDPAPGTLTIDVDDDTPIALVEVQVGGTVDEDGVLEGAADGGDGDGNPGGLEDVPGASTVVNGNVSGLFSSGADQPLTYSLLSDTSDLPVLTSNGAPVTYSVVGNTLTASANGEPVFTLVLDADTGAYTFTLLDQLDHPSLDGQTGDDTENPADSDLTIQLGSIIQATDSDGDSVTADANGLNIVVDDDSPLPFEDCPDNVVTVNDPTAVPFTGNLNLPPVGADEPGEVTFGVSDGDPVLDNQGNPVTSGEDPLFYFINSDGVLEARVGDETGELIFTITLNGDGTFTYDQIGTIGIGGTISFDSFDEADAGNTNYVGLGNDDPATQVDLLMSAGANTDGDAALEDATVNSDADSIGSQNQSMDAGDEEVLRIDFVSDLQTGGAGPTGFSFSGHVATNSFLQTVPQVQGSQSEVAAFKVWALDSSLTDAAAPDRDPAGGFSDSTTVMITEVTIIDYETGATHVEDISGLANGGTEALAFGVSVTRNADGSVTFSGIQEGDQYGVATGANDFNAVAIQATGHSFDLGVFSIGVANEFEPVDLEVPIILTDSDGDSVVCDIDIHIGVPVEAPDIAVTVNEAGLPVVGSDAGSDSEVATGNLQSQVSGGTGPYTFTLVGDGNGTFGTLVLNTDGTFTYTLDTRFDSQPDANDGTNPELGAESFTFEATDQLGATQTGTISVNIIDDVPSISVSGDTSVIEGATATGTWSETVGADQPGSTTVVVFGGSEFALGAPINTGKGTLTVNANGTWSFASNNNLDNDLAHSISFTVKVTDADGDVAQDPHTVAITDGPGPQGGDTLTLEVDDDALSDGNNSASDDEIDAGTLTFTAGSDALTSFVFGNDLSGLGGGLTWVRVDGDTITGSDGGTLIVTLQLTAPASIAAGASGDVTVTATLANNYDSHPTINVDDLVALGSVTVVAADHDGDSATGTVSVGVSDDLPVVTTAAEDSTLDGTTLQASGDFAFSLGADNYSPATTAATYLDVDLSGTVDDDPITVTQQPTFVSQVGGIATYDFTFTYDHDGNAGTPAVVNGGSVAFDLVNGGYTVTLDDDFSTTTVIPVSDVISRTGYNTEGASPSQYEIVVSELDTSDPIFVQFTAIKGPSNNTFSAGGNAAFAPGETFAGPQSWASISNDENGVAGDTIQSTDILNIDFFDANPRNPDASPNPAANPVTVDGLTLDLAKLGTGEDMVVLLKLVSASDPTDVTTRVIIIPYSEIYTEGETLPEGYTGTLGNDLGLVVIESNDFNAAGEDYVISGAQMIMSTQNISGSGIVLNGDTGADGGSDVDTLVAFNSTTVDSDVIKIVDIGLITTTTTSQDVQLTFDVTITDQDGDTATDQFVINPDPAPLVAEALFIKQSVSDSADTSSLSLMSTDSFDSQRTMSAANNNSVLLGAIAAAGLGISSAAAASGFDTGANHMMLDTLSIDYGSATAQAFAIDNREMVRDGLGIEAQDILRAGDNAVESTIQRAIVDKLSLTDSAGDQGQAPTALLQATELQSVDFAQSTLTSAAVGMPSAEMLAGGLANGNTVSVQAQGTAEVGRVLLDALAGGGGGPDIDAVIDAAANQGGGGAAALDALASQGFLDVSAWHTGGFIGFSATHVSPMMEPMLHHDAVVAA